MFSDFKPKLSELIIETLNPICATMKRLLADKGHLKQTLREGREKALAISEPILAETKKIIGFLE